MCAHRLQCAFCEFCYKFQKESQYDFHRVIAVHRHKIARDLVRLHHIHFLSERPREIFYEKFFRWHTPLSLLTLVSFYE